MKKSTLTLIVVALVALGIFGLFYASNQDDENSSTQQTQVPSSQDNADASNQTDNQIQGEQVSIDGMAFLPAEITVKKGTTVTWTNKDAVQHNVVPDDGDSEAFLGSELLSQNSSYSFTFDTPGTYTYHCGPHPDMTGSVTVTE